MKKRSIPVRRAALVAALGLLLPLSVMAQETASAKKPSRTDDVAVRVENRNWRDVHIYVSEYDGILRSLGIVTSQVSEVFHLPKTLALAGTQLRLIVDPIGGSGFYASEPVFADPADEIVLTVQNALDMSFTTLEPRLDAE